MRGRGKRPAHLVRLAKFLNTPLERKIRQQKIDQITIIESLETPTIEKRKLFDQGVIIASCKSVIALRFDCCKPLSPKRWSPS